MPPALRVIGLAALLCVAGPARAQGAPVCDAVTELNSVYFADGSGALDPTASDRLAENVQILRACPGLAVEVTGWSPLDCGRRSAAERVEDLPVRRARAVARHYVGAGLEPGQVALVRGSEETAGTCLKAEADAAATHGRGRRTDTRPLSVPALSAARRTELAAVSCDALRSLPDVPLTDRNGPPGSRPTAAGRVQLYESAHLLRRCDATRVALCGPTEFDALRIQSVLLGLGVAPRRIEVGSDACTRGTDSEVAVRVLVLGPED